MIMFENKGLIPLEAFTTFGMSAKPTSDNPIGKFGTGLKYAVAVTMRLGGQFTLFRGTDEYVFYTKKHDFRGKEFQKVKMKKRKGFGLPWSYSDLPFTTELGSHWEPWMAVRELEANCMDENGTSLIVNDEEKDHAFPVAGSTMIRIECPEMEEAFAEQDIFMEEGELIFEDDTVRVFAGESNRVFYRGMRVRDLEKPSMFTYDMKHVDLTEDRTSKFPSWDDGRIMNSWIQCTDRPLINRVIKDANRFHEGSFAWDNKQSVTNVWYSALRGPDVGGRFSTLRDNLDIGISDIEDVEIMLEVRQWLQVIEKVGYPLDEAIRDQLTDAGWKGAEAAQPATVQDR